MTAGDLQSKFDTLAGRVKDKQAELNEVNAELSGIVSRLIDADSKTRPGLIARRAELINLAGLLADEHAELARRRNTAELMIYELAFAAAQDEALRLSGLAREARQKLNAAADEHLHAINREGRRAATPEATRAIGEMEANKARLKAESLIANDAAHRAGLKRDEAEKELEEVRQRLGIT